MDSKRPMTLGLILHLPKPSLKINMSILCLNKQSSTISYTTPLLWAQGYQGYLPINLKHPAYILLLGVTVSLGPPKSDRTISQTGLWEAEVEADLCVSWIHIKKATSQAGQCWCQTM